MVKKEIPPLGRSEVATSTGNEGEVVVKGTGLPGGLLVIVLLALLGLSAGFSVLIVVLSLLLILL